MLSFSPFIITYYSNQSLHLLTTPNGSGKLSTNHYRPTPQFDRYLPLPEISHLLTALLLSSPTKISKLRLSLANNPTTLGLLLLQQLLFSPLSPLPLNLKFIRFFQTSPTSSLILIPSQPGFSKNAHLSSSPQSLTLSV